MLVILPSQLAVLEQATAERRAANGAARMAASGAPQSPDVLRRTWARCAEAADALGWTDDRLVDRLARLTLAPSSRPPDLVTAAIHTTLTGDIPPETALTTLERQLL